MEELTFMTEGPKGKKCNLSNSGGKIFVNLKDFFERKRIYGLSMDEVKDAYVY